MPDRITVLIVDDIPETREHLSKLLGFESDIAVAGTAESGPEALEIAQRVRPDVVLMDINMPGMDGIATSEQLSALVPTAAVIMMSVQGEADYLRRSMLAGAREFLVKPFSADELTTSIHKVYAREREKQARTAEQRVETGGGGRDGDQPGGRGPGTVVTIFSPKGGVGRSTIAVNLACAAVALGRKVALVDGSLQFGDVGVMLNLDSRHRSLADLVPEMAAGDPESLDTAVLHHDSGVDVLLAPPTPETAELIAPPYVHRVLERLREDHDLVVVDTPAVLNDMTLAMLDVADRIVVLLTLEITNIRNLRLFLEVARQLGYDDRVMLVLNRADSSLGIRVADVERSIGLKVEHSVVSDGRSVVYALNRGVPFVMSNPEAQVSQDLTRLAKALIGVRAESREAEPAAARPGQRRSLFAWR